MPILDKDTGVKKEDAEVRCRIVRVNSETGEIVTRRVIFEGLDADARTFVANNFPRPHIEEGNALPPDVVLQTMKDDRVLSTQQFHATNGWTDYKQESDGE